MHKKWLVMGLAAWVTGSAQAQDIRDQLDVKISKAELVFPQSQPQEVATLVKEAISQFAIPASLSYLPTSSQPSARPGAPVVKRLSVVSQEYVCDGAYAEIKKSPPPVKNAFAYIREGHHVCLYEFEKGVKAYVMYYNIKKLESLTSGLFNGITRAIRGSDEDRAKGQLEENIGWIREKLPNVLVERLEVPGKPVETPDAEAVAQWIPKAQPAIAVAAAPGAGAPVPVAVAAAPSAAQNKIEARKNLTAMGLTYHSQPQFFEAIQRQDDVAVQLFVDSGALNGDTKDSKGRTALQLAQSLGNAELVALLQKPVEAVPAVAAAPVAPVAATFAATATATSTPTTAAVTPTPTLLRKDTALASADYDALPEDMRKELDEELAKLNLSEQDLATARQNLASQYVQVKTLSTLLGNMKK